MNTTERMRACLAEVGFPDFLLPDDWQRTGHIGFSPEAGVTIPQYVAWKARVIADPHDAPCWECFGTGTFCDHRPLTVEQMETPPPDARDAWQMFDQFARYTYHASCDHQEPTTCP